jgi:hypothetical protein
MSDRKQSYWSWIVATLIGLPLFYVLSSGPFGWLIFHVPDSMSPTVIDIYNTIYRPLAWAWQSSPEAARFLRWYNELWGIPII